MDVGQPQREIYIEPLELPEPLRPAVEPDHKPQVEPEKEPARNG